MQLTLNDILSINFLEIYNNNNLGNEPFNGVSIDSRTTTSGNLFFAIRGTKVDGHNFLAGAISNGAAAVVVDKEYFSKGLKFKSNIKSKKLFTATIIVVENTTVALGELATVFRKKFQIPFLAVAGSNGKTTTKDMIGKVLSEKFDTLVTEGNLNNHIGVPLTLFGLRRKHQAAVIEIGTNHFGEVENLCKILQPTHGLITNIGNEHLEFFKDINGVAKEEGELFKHLASCYDKSVAFVNADDKRVLKLSRTLAHSIFFGSNKNNMDIACTGQTINESGKYSIEVFVKKSKKRYRVNLSIPGKHNIQNALAAFAVGIQFKVPTTKIVKALESFKTSGKRMEIVSVNKVNIINDTYNANLDSMLSAIEVLKQTKSEGKKIMVLGDMLELGKSSKHHHTLIGEAINKYFKNVAEPIHLFTFGNISQHINRTAKLKNKKHYTDKKSMAVDLLKIISSGDVVLVKGSRGMRMEDIVSSIIERLR